MDGSGRQWKAMQRRAIVYEVSDSMLYSMSSECMSAYSGIIGNWVLAVLALMAVSCVRK